MSKILGIKSSLRERDGHALYDSLSGIMLQGVLEKVREISDFTTETINLARLNLQPCRGCFSDMETRCHFLCDCYDDDFKMIAEKVMEADGIIFSTPTYMFGMSSVLKRFFERWISFKAPPIPQENATKSLDECFELIDKLEDGTIGANNPLQGKVGGIVVAGSELGQDNVAKEIMLILNLYGFILPPQCFIYHTGHSMQSLEDVREGFYKNQWLLMATENLARSMVQMIELTGGRSWPEMEKILYKP
jgi:multimeric flavodoxin WrbA